MINTAKTFSAMVPAMKPCAKCGTNINYKKFVQWPDLGPNLCNPCGDHIDTMNHKNAMESMEKEMILNSRIPECYNYWDKAQSAERNTKSMHDWLCNAGRETSIYWGGSNGAGKTHTVCNAALHLIRDIRISVRFFKCSQWLTLLMQLKTSDNDTFNKEVQLAATCSIAVFDDIGKEKPTEAKLEVLYNIIDLREQQKKTTWFTSNYKLSQLPERCGDNYGNAIKVRIDRMCGNSVV